MFTSGPGANQEKGRLNIWMSFFFFFFFSCASPPALTETRGAGLGVSRHLLDHPRIAAHRYWSASWPPPDPHSSAHFVQHMTYFFPKESVVPRESFKEPLKCCVRFLFFFITHQRILTSQPVCLRRCLAALLVASESVIVKKGEEKKIGKHLDVQAS